MPERLLRPRDRPPPEKAPFREEEGQEQERLEGWIMSEVERGVALPGLYPPNDEAKARYAATRK